MLPIIERFDRATDPALYRRLPSDWAMATADVVGSTALANSGRRRDINFIAGAVIAAVQAAIAETNADPVAAQFGGDGATIAVPPEARGRVRQVMRALGHWAHSTFGIELRVGLIDIAALEAQDAPVLAALYDAGGGNYYGLFLGRGAGLAESLIKTDPDQRLAPEPGPVPGLDILSCRWEPVPSERGVILSIIADPVAEGPDGLRAVAELRAGIDAIAGIDTAAPLGSGRGLVPRLSAIPRAIRREVLAQPLGRRFSKAMAAALLTVLLWVLYRTGWTVGGFDQAVYRGRTAQHTDFRRISAGLRLVLDVTPAAAEAIEALLEDQFAQRRIVYGLHRSDAATLTCLVQNPVTGRHIHFVDGDGLGMWQASIGYKSRKAALG